MRKGGRIVIEILSGKIRNNPGGKETAEKWCRQFLRSGADLGFTAQRRITGKNDRMAGIGQIFYQNYTRSLFTVPLRRGIVGTSEE